MYATKCPSAETEGSELGPFGSLPVGVTLTRSVVAPAASAVAPVASNPAARQIATPRLTAMPKESHICAPGLSSDE